MSEGSKKTCYPVSNQPFQRLHFYKWPSTIETKWAIYQGKAFLHLQSKKWLEFFCPTSTLLSLKVTRIVGLDMKDNKSDQFLHPRIQAGLLLFCSIVSISHHLDFKKVKKKIWKYIDLIEKSSNNFGAKGWLHQGMWVGICRLVVLWWGRGTQIYDFFLVY